ncbi:sigma-70 family RNA polymerase sigma factor [Streptomyces sp. NPDC050433]|uniref:sigma-70 family RNA polymerase sigma factor n=1 Tax=Streptomyces sp. NPDC050433 TaxID=3365615 RepID=UPI0037BD2991
MGDVWSEVTVTEEAHSPACDSDPNNRFTTLRRPLMSAAMAKSSDRNFAEDAVQITMEKVFKRFPDLGLISDSRLVQYSRKVLSHVIVDEFRNNKKLPIIPVPPEVLPEGTSSIGIPESVLVAELRSEIYKFITELPKTQRKVVDLAIVRELPLEEVAKEMDVEVDTVRRYLGAARRRLEKAMVASSEEVSA